MIVTDQLSRHKDSGVANILRDVARQYLRTEHVLLMDIDMVPSSGLAYEYEQLVKDTSAGEGNGPLLVTIPGQEINITCIILILLMCDHSFLFNGHLLDHDLSLFCNP